MDNAPLALCRTAFFCKYVSVSLCYITVLIANTSKGRAHTKVGNWKMQLVIGNFNQLTDNCITSLQSPGSCFTFREVFTVNEYQYRRKQLGYNLK